MKEGYFIEVGPFGDVKGQGVGEVSSFDEIFTQAEIERRPDDVYEFIETEKSMIVLYAL